MLNEGLKIAKEVRDPACGKTGSIEDWGFKRVAIAYAKNGMFEESLEIASLIEWDEQKRETIDEIAKIYVEAQERDKNILNKMLKIADGIRCHDDKGRAFIAIVPAYASAGMYDDAMKLTNLIED